MENKWCAWKVTNISLNNNFFGKLCDILNENLHYCHDWRIVSNFDEKKENPYWISRSYDVGSNIIKYGELDIRDICNIFIKDYNLNENCIKIELVSEE